MSGLCAAYELVRAGCNVTVFEATDTLGGRCDSKKFATSTDIAEMGSMRFPPTEFILDFYLKNSNVIPGGLCSLPDFPDPGVEWTYVCYGKGPPIKWKKTQGSYPAGFKTVWTGWVALVTNGLNSDLPGAQAITNLLAGGDIAKATGYWQNYLDAFGQQTFYSALYEIFTGAGNKYPIPGGTPWTFEDFDRFGALGLGSGGFGPLYPISFMDIFRLIVNELETTQKFLQPSKTLNDGIRTLPIQFANYIYGLNTDALQYNTGIFKIGGTNSNFTLGAQNGTAPGPFAKVIVATTTRAMELTLGLTRYNNPLVSPAVAQAIMRTHVVSSNKVAARIKNYWANDPNAIRCLQTDNLVHQVYTLDYTPAGQSPDGTGVCFLSYVWDDDAVKQQAITSGVPSGPADNKRLYDYLLIRLKSIGEPVTSWADNLKPWNNDYTNNVFFEEWQSSPYFAGAFKLSEPGQDQYVQRMFFDYQKAGTTSDTGVYIAGDCVSWTSGWVEGALTTGLNAAAGVIKSLGGTVNPDAQGKTPLTINANRYKYF